MEIVNLLIQTGLEIIYFTGVIILVGLILGGLETMAARNFQRSLGRNAVMVTGVIGTPIHECSHALLCVVFRHRITAIKLFQRPDQNGVLGYVNHSFSKRNIYQRIGNFFIGIAPIFGGILVIVILMNLLIPQAFVNYISILSGSLGMQSLSDLNLAAIANAYMGLIKTIFAFENFQNIRFYIFLFLTTCISSHMSLSFADIKGSFDGLIFIFLLLLIFNFLNVSQYISLPFNLVQYNFMISAILMISVIFSTITFLISLGLHFIFPR